MPIHNSEHNSSNNSDHDDDIHDSFTRISKLDISDPLHLHPNDTTALTVGHNGSSIADYYHKLNALWKQYDAMIELTKCVCNASEGFKKHNQLLKLMQFFMGLDDSYMQIRSSILSRETLLDVRSAYATIFSEESHRVAVGSIVGSSQRNQASAFVSNVPNSQNFQRNNQNFSTGPSRPNNVINNRQCGGSGLNINRPSGGSGLVCENCGFNGYTIDRCFKIIGYPADFGKKKSGQNFKKQSVSNNNYVGKSSSSGFTNEQMATLISLIKDNKVRKMCRLIWQHMTYTDKELDIILDISHLKIKVGHPNRTEAYISKIRNLRLSNGLTFYDVIVIPEYCVTLISVHKLIKENKVIVAFDENMCYFLNQDLNLKNVLGIGEQCEGFYSYNDKGIKSNTSTLRFQCMLSQHDWHCRLGHLTDPVLNVLKDSLNIDKKDNTVCCEICQRVKQTREPFPLSDHKSKSLGDLVHLDLWGLYKVTSSEEFRFFLTIVDDYTRAVWDSEVGKNDSTNVFQDVNHINFFDIEYPEIPNDDERVANDLNKGKSDSSSSSVSGSNINTADFPVDSGNDADSSNDFVDTQNEEVATLEENIFSEGNLDQNPSSSQEGRKAIGSKWIFKIKFRSSGEIDRYKTRLVAQGFGQKEGIDYEETFSPVVKMVTVRCLLNIVVSMSWPSDKGVFFALLVYVDDIIITGNSVSEIEKFKVFLKSKFMIKDLGKLKDFLGIEVVDTDKGICLNQRKYVLDLLSEYGMLACKPAKTPLMSNEASDKDPLLENITDYHKLMGKLIYLTNTRPDISYVVHCLSQFMHSHLTSHLKIDFKILRYLKSCPGLGVHVTKTSGMFLTAYSDADCAKCIVTRKSVTGNSAIKIAANPVFHERTKHLEIDLHFVREKVLKGVVKTGKVDSANQIANILTKGDTVQHLELIKKLGIELMKLKGWVPEIHNEYESEDKTPWMRKVKLKRTESRMNISDGEILPDLYLNMRAGKIIILDELWDFKMERRQANLEELHWNTRGKEVMEVNGKKHDEYGVYAPQRVKKNKLFRISTRFEVLIDIFFYLIGLVEVNFVDVALLDVNRSATKMIN
ncbi:ribonuclease H-like domain-containing protein [Tanacetum coccineum]|uniref:Ribonuclease H-like domain-containing protein n=1 Tax=Tanacetum coccineum TaxID=301880 RepID=A0ABQ5HRC8_9ASTR